MYGRKILSTQPEYYQKTDNLQNERITAVEAVQTYQRLALAAHRRTNCVTRFADDAVDVARQLDLEYQGKQKPPLFGIPVSVKGWNEVDFLSCMYKPD